jgi:hypothetical protein
MVQQSTDDVLSICLAFVAEKWLCTGCEVAAMWKENERCITVPTVSWMNLEANNYVDVSF